MVVRNVRWPDDQDAILEYIRLVYGEHDYNLLAESYGQTPTFDPADCLVIDGDNEGEIAAHGMIVPRQLQIGTGQLPTAEISLLGAVEQDSGYEEELLHALHARMSERGYALGLSFGLPVLFEPWGYEYAVGLYLTSYESDISTELAQRAGRWNLEHSYERRTADQLGVRNTAVTVRRFYLNDLPAIQALYAAESARGHYLLGRDEAAWTWQLDYLTRTERYGPDDFLVAEVDERLVAYVRVVSQAPVNAFRAAQAADFSVIEAGGDHPDGIEALLGEVAHVAQALDTTRIGLFVHPASRLMRHALAHGASLRSFTGAGFVRLHDLALTMEILQPELDIRRWESRFADRAYHLAITTEDDQVEIRLGRGEPEMVELEIPATSLVRLITGWYTIDHLKTGYYEQHQDLLRVLFPRRDPRIGLADLI